MISVVFFDMGGVVYTSVENVFPQLIKDTFGIPNCTPNNPMFDFVQELFRDLDTDRIDEKTFWQEFCNRTGTQLPRNWQKLLPQMFYDQKLNARMEQFIKNLRQNRIKVFALSNISEKKAQENRKKEVYDMFDGMFLSCDLGYWKPDKTIFRYALENVKEEPSNALFIDDVLTNIIGARELGMYGIQFVTDDQFAQEVAKLSLPVTY